MFELTTVQVKFPGPPHPGDSLSFDVIRGSWFAHFAPVYEPHWVGAVTFLRDVDALDHNFYAGEGHLYLRWRVTIVHDPAKSTTFRFSVKCGGGEGVRLLGFHPLGAIILTQDPEDS